jgi:ribosomal protein S18 acetylase RimI-like enzyme
MIRKAIKKDIPKILDLLKQVCLVHYNSRPDIFKVGTKYSAKELKVILKDKTRPILVSVDENDEVQGYCFCTYVYHINNAILTDITTLYIDDLCVDEKLRGKGIGKELYQSAVNLAKDTGCYNLTLNVWGCNQSAIKFYEALGLVPQKIGMELILQ